jgi:hypothetical protein
MRFLNDHLITHLANPLSIMHAMKPNPMFDPCGPRLLKSNSKKEAEILPTRKGRIPLYFMKDPAPTGETMQQRQQRAIQNG